MPDDDDNDYTNTDLSPREPDRFEKRGETSENGEERRPNDGRHETRENG